LELSCENATLGVNGLRLQWAHVTLP